MKNKINSLNNYYILYRKSILIFLKILLICITLCTYKYVYEFRINQHTILKLSIFLLIIIWMIKIINTSELSLKITKLNLSLALFALVLLISLFFSKSKMVSLQELMLFLSYVVLFFLVTNHVLNKKDFNRLIYLFFILSFIVSAYTLIQYYGFDPYLYDLGKLTSTIGQKNWISNYLAMIFPIGFSYFLLEDNKKVKVYYFIFLSIIYTTLLICQSRGIWISIILTIIFALIIIYKYKLLNIFKNNKKWLIALLIIFLAITTIYSTENPLNKSRLTVTERAVSTLDRKDPSVNARLLIWRTTHEMIKDNPIIGAGIGSFEMKYLFYQAEILKEASENIKYYINAAESHNEYLQMWAEIGIIGLGIFLIILAILYKQFLLFFRQEEDIQKKIIAWGMILGITCFLVHSLFTFPLHVPALASTFFVILGLALVYINNFNLPEIKIKTGINHIMVKFLMTIFIIVIMGLLINLLVIKPYVAELYYFNGMRHNVDNNYEKSIPDFQYAFLLDPYNGRNLHALGSSYFNIKMYAKAEDMLRKAKNYFVDINTYRNLGLVYVRTGKTEKAIEEFEHAIYLDPKFWEAYNDLASLYVYQGKYERAIEQWQKAIDLDLKFKDKYIFLYYIGISYQRMGNQEEAYNYFLEALKEVPDDSPIMEDIERELLKIYQSTNVPE